MRPSRQHVSLIPGVHVDVGAAEHQNSRHEILASTPLNLRELVQNVAALERVQHADDGDVRGVQVLLQIPDLVERGGARG